MKTLRSNEIQALLANTQTTKVLPFLHDLGFEYRSRVALHKKKAGCPGCKGELITEDLVARAITKLQAEGPKYAAQLVKLFGQKSLTIRKPGGKTTDPLIKII